MDKFSIEYLKNSIKNLNNVVNANILTEYGIEFNNDNLVDIISGGEITKIKVNEAKPSMAAQFDSLISSVKDITKDFPYIIPEYYMTENNKVVLNKRAYEIYNGYIAFYKSNPESVEIFNALSKFIYQWDCFKAFAETKGHDAKGLVLLENEPVVHYESIRGYKDFAAHRYDEMKKRIFKN